MKMINHPNRSKRSQHTAGPWKIAFYTDGNVTPHVDMVAVIKPDGRWPHLHDQICALPEAGRGRANALLMAAAPDMLAACLKLAAWDQSSDDPVLISEACSLARAAILKTRGEP